MLKSLSLTTHMSREKNDSRNILIKGHKLISSVLISQGEKNSMILGSFDPSRCESEINREIEMLFCVEMHLAGSLTSNLGLEVHESRVIAVNSFAGD